MINLFKEKYMERFKLIVVAGDENATGEYENVVTGIENAETKSKELLKEYIDDYPDAYVACYPYYEDIHLPEDDYECWIRDDDGIESWWTMKMGTYSRIGFTKSML